MRFLSAAFLILAAAGCAPAADTIAVLPLFNLNESKSPNLNWIGESVAETVHDALSSGGVLVLAREDREEVYRRLSVRPGVVLTKASVIKIGETLDAGQAVYGEFSVETPENAIVSLRSSLRIAVHVIDLRKFRESPVFEQTGSLENLSLMESKLAWMVVKQLVPNSAPSEPDFLAAHAAVRVDAKESYVRGLMATNPDQKMKLFSQAARLDDRFSPPAFQIGRMLVEKKEHRSAALWLAKVSKTDPHYLEGSFLLGICDYYNGDFERAIQQFRLVAKEIPLNEVYNDLGAALSRKNDPASLENFNKALEGDEADPDYWFNSGYALWKRGQFTQAADRFRAVLDRSREDQEATLLLGRCLKGEGPRAGDPRSEGRERIKTVFEDSAFRQLQAELKKK